MMDGTRTLPAQEQQDFTFSERDFQLISRMANARYGLFLQPSKKALVHSRLAKRLRALQLDSFEAYCALLERPEGDQEQVHLLSALTTNVTHFFREAHHFTMLRDKIAPQLLRKAQSGQPVRLWSAACSSGQEAYSMAATLLDAAPDLSQQDIKILATDIDTKVVQVARAGVYPAEELDALAEPWRKTLAYTRSGSDAQMDDALRQLISFAELNLVADWPMKRHFDVILCRNAAIYFDKTTQARLWQRFADALCNDGFLMIGHSERLSGPAVPAFRNVGVTSYQRNSRQKGGTK